MRAYHELGSVIHLGLIVYDVSAYIVRLQYQQIGLYTSIFYINKPEPNELK